VPSDKGLDRPAFAQLYEQRADDLLVFFTRRTLDPEIARDLWAETFAQAFAARRRFRGQSSEQAVSWLYGIAYRQLALYHRRGQAERRAPDRLGLQQPQFGEEDVERLVALADLDTVRGGVAAALSQLKPALRDAVRLRVVDELPYEQVAARLGISEQAARARVSRGLRALRHHASPSPLDPTTIEVTS
jgi:RNA polymerase sigma-70 factor (ECF subfamily)